MLAVAMGWHIYALTHSAFALGLVGLAQFLPMFLLDARRRPFRGPLRSPAHRGHLSKPRKRRGIAVRVGHLRRMDQRTGDLCARRLRGAARASNRRRSRRCCPASCRAGNCRRRRRGRPRRTRPRRSPVRALGGLLYGIGPGAAYLACTLSFTAAATAVWGILLRAKPASRAPVTLESVFSGIAFIRKQPVILGALSLDLFAVLFGGATALLPVFARDKLHAGRSGSACCARAPRSGALGGHHLDLRISAAQPAARRCSAA